MQLYSIGQASAMIGIPVPTIRYYERVGLCSPSLIDECSGYRYYSIDDIFQLDLIRCLGRQLGMPLKTIRRYLKESDNAETMKNYLRQQAANIDAQIAELALRKDFLSEKLEAIEHRENTPTLSPYMEKIPSRELSVRKMAVESLDDAMLLARKTAARAGMTCGHELFLIFDVLDDKFASPGTHSVTIGISGRVNGGNLVPLFLEPGWYVSIDYPNRSEARDEAIARLRAYMKEIGLEKAGPMVSSGSLIDTTSVSSRDYYVKTQIFAGRRSSTATDW